MTIQSFDPKNLATIRKELDSAVAQIAKNHGIALSVGRISYQNDTFSTKITAVIGNPNAPKIPGNAKWQKNFKDLVRFNTIVNNSNKLKAEDLGKFVNLRGTKHQIVGAMGGKAIDNTIILSNSAGKFIRADETVVANALKSGV